MDDVRSGSAPGSYRHHLSDGRLAIFLLHGVVEEGDWGVRNYTRKHIEADYFRRFLEDLLREGSPLSMDDVLRHCRDGRPFPRKSFAITFDDGFWNNLGVAAPILREMGVPATFYVTSGFVDGNAMSWIDRIEECLETTPRGSLRLPWLPAPLEFASRADKIRILDAVRAKVKGDPGVDADALVQEIARQCGRSAPTASETPLDRKLTWAEARELASDGSFLVGGHSHRHGILSFLGQGALEEEIETSLQLMRAKAGIATRHYSYPEGLAHCFDERVIRALKDRGIECCPTAMPGDNAPGADPFRLRRILVV